MSKKISLSSINIFWNRDGEMVFNNVAFSGVFTKKQEKAIPKSIKRMGKFVLKEVEKLNKI